VSNLADRLRAEVEAWSDSTGTFVLGRALIGVLDRHGSREFEWIDADGIEYDALMCTECGEVYPCPTIQGIAEDLNRGVV